MVPWATPTATSLPPSTASSPVPPPPTARVLEAAATLATRNSPALSVTEPWPPAWLPIVALKAVTWPVVPPTCR